MEKQLKNNWTSGKDCIGRRYYNKAFSHANIFVSLEDTCRDNCYYGGKLYYHLWRGTVRGDFLSLDIKNMPQFLNESLSEDELKDIEEKAIQIINSEIKKDKNEILTIERRIQHLQWMLD